MNHAQRMALCKWGQARGVRIEFNGDASIHTAVYEAH
jgi:hypothetical protein